MATNKYDAFVVDLASLEEANTALSDAHQLIWDTGRSDGSLSMCVGDAPALRAALQELDGNWALHRTKMLEEIQQVQKKVWGLIDDIKTVDDQGRGGPAQGVTAEGQSPRPRATGDAGAPSPAPTAPTGSPSGERHVEPDPGGAPVTGTGPSGGQAPVLDPGAEAADREGLREELEEARRRAEEEARIAQERVDDANRSILEKMLSSDAGIALLKRWATEAQNLMSQGIPVASMGASVVALLTLAGLMPSPPTTLGPSPIGDIASPMPVPVLPVDGKLIEPEQLIGTPERPGDFGAFDPAPRDPAPGVEPEVGPPNGEPKSGTDTPPSDNGPVATSPVAAPETSMAPTTASGGSGPESAGGSGGGSGPASTGGSGGGSAGASSAAQALREMPPLDASDLATNSGSLPAPTAASAIAAAGAGVAAGSALGASAAGAGDARVALTSASGGITSTNPQTPAPTTSAMGAVSALSHMGSSSAAPPPAARPAIPMATSSAPQTTGSAAGAGAANTPPGPRPDPPAPQYPVEGSKGDLDADQEGEGK